MGVTVGVSESQMLVWESSGKAIEDAQPSKVEARYGVEVVDFVEDEM